MRSPGNQLSSPALSSRCWRSWAGRTRRTGAAVGGLGFVVLLLLPPVVWALDTYPLPSLELTAPAAPVAAPAVLLQQAMAMPDARSEAVDAGYSFRQVAVTIWLMVALGLVLRLLAGLATLRQWVRNGRQAEFPALNRIMVGGGVPPTTRLLVSDEVPAPLSFGWRRPVIMLDLATLADLPNAEAVVAHEAAHLARGDWPRLVAARLAVALFWFNPFVWLLERLYLQSVEEAADAQAAGVVDPACYAQALLNVARNASVPLGANSIASGSLARRIRRLLSGGGRSRWDGPWRVGAITTVAVIAVPVALVQIVAPSISAAAPLVAVPAPSRLGEPTTVAYGSPAAVAAVASAPSERSSAALPIGPVAPTPAAAAVARAPETEARDVLDRDEIARIRQASEAMRAQSLVVARDSRKIAERARAEAAVAMAGARQEMLRGADEMERGAIEMKRGAAQMREEARKLSDPAYRAKVIAEARANAASWTSTRWKQKVPTDQELIDAIPRMEDGARRMDEGVDKMREGAAKMRRSAQEH